FSSLSGLSSGTTVSRRVSCCLGRLVGDRVGRMLVVIVGSVVMDDCQSLCRSYVLCRVCRHGRPPFVVWVVISVIVWVICWSSLRDRSSWTTVSRRVGRMFLVVVKSVVMDDCLSSFGSPC